MGELQYYEHTDSVLDLSLDGASGGVTMVPLGTPDLGGAVQNGIRRGSAEVTDHLQQTAYFDVAHLA